MILILEGLIQYGGDFVLAGIFEKIETHWFTLILTIY